MLTNRATLPAILGLALFCSPACTGDVADPSRRQVPRSERHGIFADLVLYPRLDALGGPFFIDRFETTVADYQRFLDATDRDPPAGMAATLDDHGRWQDSLPVVGITFPEARSFAHWRWCRLVRADEWRFAATAGGEYRYPWGNRQELIWANTADLGLMRRTPVGTFESGRQSFGAHDLIGNVAEWTETVPDWFFRPGGEEVLDGVVIFRLVHADSGARFLRGQWPVRLQWQTMMPLPAAWLVAAVPGAPREVVGGHFSIRMHREAARASVEMVPKEWADHVGIRLATSPRELVRALLDEPDPSRDLLSAVARFASKPAHQRPLAAACEAVLAERPGPGQADLARGPMMYALRGGARE